MKRRLLAILCALAVLVGILAVTAAAKEEKATFRVGYSMKDINPWVDPDDWTKGMMPIPLAGYGESYARLTKGWMDDNGDGEIDDQDGLKTTCIAVTDDDDNTILLIAYDMIGAADSHVKSIRESIVAALDGAVGMDDIMISASHSHYSPDIGVSMSKVEESMKETVQNAVDTFKQRVIDQMTAAAVEAMANRKVASEVSKSETDASDTVGYTVNGVRHYVLTGYNAKADVKNVSWYAGDNFGAMTDVGKTAYGTMAGYKITKVKHVTQANDKLYMLQFHFDDGSQPIVLANWRGHTTLNRHSTDCRPNPGVTDELTGFDCISGDYPNAFRYQMSLKGVRVSFVNGASGNINNRSRDSDVTNDWSTIWENGKLRINGELIPNDINKSIALGKVLTAVAMEGMKEENRQICQPGAIRNLQVRYGMEPHTFDEDLEGLMKAIEAFEADETASSANNGKGLFPYSYRWTEEEGGDGKLYTLNSRFHVSTVKSRASSISEGVAKMELDAIMLGDDIAFVSGPGEMYDYYDAAGSTKPEDNDWLTLITKQYGTPFVLGYTNGSHSYIPNTLAFDYNKDHWQAGVGLGRGSYGSNISQIARGGGELIIAEFKHMLELLNDDDAFRTAWCEHCKKAVEWTPLLKSNNGDNTWYGGHYYLYEDIGGDYSRVKSLASEQICLDLNGHTLESMQGLSSISRAFIVNNGTTLNIMDSVGGGKVVAPGTVGNYGGGLMYIYPEGELNLYGGTLERINKEGFSSSSGGTICANGTVNMYGGTIIGGHTDSYGGAIYSSSVFNMYGGTVRGGSAGVNGQNSHFTSKATVNLSGGTFEGQVYMYPSRLTISGDVVLTYLDLINSNKMKVGTLGEKASITVKAKNGIFTDANGGTPANAAHFHAVDGCYISATSTGMFAGDKWYCECGGTKPLGHTCENIAWAPWTSTTSFPLSNGNYYLTADVTTSSEQYVAKGNKPRVDLNGHNITYKVPASKAPVLEGNNWTSNTRVLSMYINSEFVLTDSTKNPGKISRDTSALTQEQISHITNWGLLVLINGQDSGQKVPATFTMYNGILDGSNSVTSGGGGAVSVHNTESTFRMYGGTIKGATALYGGAVMVNNGGNAEFYGGKITGGKGTAGYGDCVCVHSTADPVIFSGDVDIDEFYLMASNPTNALEVRGSYTGTVAVKLAKAASGKVIGTAVNADITDATITCKNDASMKVVAENGQLKVRKVDSSVAAVIPGTTSETTYKTVQAAVDAYKSGVIILVKSDAGTVTIPSGKTVHIDLNGNNLTNVAVNGKLYVQDSMTDDFSVADGKYGKITGNVTGTVDATPVVDGVGYLKLTESDKSLSFHKVQMGINGMALRPGSVGVYYTSQFLGDERVKANVSSYGVVLSLKGAPVAANGKFSSDCSASSFTTFDAGVAGNNKNSTLLDGVMKQSNSDLVNKQNAVMPVYGNAYIKLKDGTILLGEGFDLSLRDLVLIAVEDGIWQTHSEDAKEALAQMYNKYTAVMRDWNIPNLKTEAAK